MKEFLIILVMVVFLLPVFMVIDATLGYPIGKRFIKPIYTTAEPMGYYDKNGDFVFFKK